MRLPDSGTDFMLHLTPEEWAAVFGISTSQRHEGMIDGGPALEDTFRRSILNLHRQWGVDFKALRVAADGGFWSEEEPVGQENEWFIEALRQGRFPNFEHCLVIGIHWLQDQDTLFPIEMLEQTLSEVRAQLDDHRRFWAEQDPETKKKLREHAVALLAKAKKESQQQPGHAAPPDNYQRKRYKRAGVN